MNAGLTSEARTTYTASFMNALAEKADPDWFRPVRAQAFDAFLNLGWPTGKQEEWRFTDVRPLLRETPLLPATGATGSPRFDEQLLALGRETGQRLCFLDGHYDASQDVWRQPPPGLRVVPLSSGFGSAGLARVLGHHLHSHDAFAFLNTAFLVDGAFVEIPTGLRVDAPILLVFLAAAKGGASFPRTVVLAGADSRATVVELHLGAYECATLSNAVTEIVLEPGAQLDYYTITRPSPTGGHIGHLAVTQQQGSSFAACSVALGGRLVRNDAHVVLDGERCDCRLDGLYLAADGNHVDNQTSIDHQSAGCRSRETYRGVVAGRGRAVWSGRAIVRPGAQGSDARQVSRSLVLSDGAVIHAKPHLEIFANDVKCSHGATTGRLDTEALFYLRSRGVGAEEARQMLIAAFLREAIAAVRNDELHNELESVIDNAAQALARSGGGG